MFAHWIKRACCMNTYRLKTIARHFIFMYMQTQLSLSRKLNCIVKMYVWRRMHTCQKLFSFPWKGYVVSCLEIDNWLCEDASQKNKAQLLNVVGFPKSQGCVSAFPSPSNHIYLSKVHSLPKPPEIQRSSHYTIHPIAHQPCPSTPPPVLGKPSWCCGISKRHHNRLSITSYCLMSLWLLATDNVTATITMTMTITTTFTITIIHHSHCHYNYIYHYHYYDYVNDYDGSLAPNHISIWRSSALIL